MKPCIEGIDALEIRDSRRNPTARVNVHLDNGTIGTASVPSGASTGENEAVAPTFAEALRYGAETFHALHKILAKKGYSTSVGDEGGIAPQLKSNEEACDLIVEAIAAAGYEPGKDITIALDPAASSFYEDSKYRLMRSEQGDKSSTEMVELFTCRVDKYPIVSIEDGHAENDWDGFAVAMDGGQIKTGSACRSERMAKYNRLLEIERELGQAAVSGK